MGKGRKPQIKETISPDSDEEIDEDEAFNSDDERKYGSFFNSKKKAGSDDDDDDDSEEASSDDDDDMSGDEKLASDDDDSDEGDGGQYMLELLNQLGKKSASTKDISDNDRDNGSALASHVKESEFAASVVKKAELTLDNLMSGIQDTKGFGNLQKVMTQVAEGQATPAPAARVVSDRAKRMVHYQKQTKEVSRWQDTVNENREAELLDFRVKERLEVNKEVLVEKFTPMTDFEKELHEALKEAGAEDEEAILKAEEKRLQDDLGENGITIEEFKARQGQLAKMRALMFYHEQKRHHINKIKSKKYRKIRKKQKARMQDRELEAEIDQNPDILKELEEKEELERMKERASLAHKNTSKWAKRVLRRGKNVDIHTRRALSAMIC
jgi:U3 small nucleolar RNA-associated protein 14